MGEIVAYFIVLLENHTFIDNDRKARMDVQIDNEDNEMDASVQDHTSNEMTKVANIYMEADHERRVNKVAVYKQIVKVVNHVNLKDPTSDHRDKHQQEIREV